MRAREKTSRLDAKVAEMAAWWRTLPEENRRRAEAAIAGAGRLAQEALDATGDADQFGAKFWDVVMAMGASFFFFGKGPPDVAVSVKRGWPEFWPMLEPFLPPEVSQEVRDREERRA